MMEQVLFLLLGLTLIIGCGNKAEKTAEDAIQLTVSQVVENAEQYVEKSVKIEGTVMHVCRHGGKRLFLAGENPDVRFKVVAGEAIPVFDVALEGSDLVVTGVMKEDRIDAAYLDQQEADLLSAAPNEAEHEALEQGHADSVTHVDQNAERLAQIKDLRKQLEESGKDYLAYYSIEVQSLEEKK